MGPIKGHDDIGFDLDKAKKCADVYSCSVGVSCFVIDTHGSPLYASRGGEGHCTFCRNVQSLSGNVLNCSNAQLYGGYQAERFGGRYIFFCPMGFAHWASPITTDGVMRGAIISGPVQMVEPDEFLLDEIIRKHNLKDEYVKELREYANHIPVIRPEVVSSLSEMLYMVSSHIAGRQPSQYQDERDNLEHQSDISSYIYYIKTMGGSENPQPAYPLEKEKELLTLIAEGDKTNSRKVLNEILGHIFFTTGGNFEVIKARVLELIVLLSRAALEGGADVEQIFGLNYKYLSEIHSFNTVEDLTFWLSKIMGRFSDCVFNLSDVKHVDVIYKAINYIKQSYMKKITLEDVASHIYLSPSYFSKIFKDEMKCNFNTYLNIIRIEMSRKLLLDDSVALVDIANLVGYEDQSYFSKVFKKTTGVSPGKYRESRGQLKK